jgi:TATA-box binding protein (TBP) (component of TFIID and TFIIIB)
MLITLVCIQLEVIVLVLFCKRAYIKYIPGTFPKLILQLVLPESISVVYNSGEALERLVLIFYAVSRGTA